MRRQRTRRLEKSDFRFGSQIAQPNETAKPELAFKSKLIRSCWEDDGYWLHGKRGFDSLHPLHSASTTCTVVQESAGKPLRAQDHFAAHLGL
jgi:hypothetical protein